MTDPTKNEIVLASGSSFVPLAKGRVTGAKVVYDANKFPTRVVSTSDSAVTVNFSSENIGVLAGDGAFVDAHFPEGTEDLNGVTFDQIERCSCYAEKDSGTATILFVLSAQKGSTPAEPRKIPWTQDAENVLAHLTIDASLKLDDQIKPKASKPK